MTEEKILENKKRLDRTVDLWYRKWKRGNTRVFDPDECPMCSVDCLDCLFNNRCGGYVTMLRNVATVEVLRHLLQLRLYLYGDVKRWTK